MRRRLPRSQAVTPLAGVLLAFNAEALEVERLAPLPQPVSNNAVAVATLDGQQWVLSLAGLGAGKTWRDVHAQSWLLNPVEAHWQALPPLPGNTGRLAATAVGLGESVLIFGGFSLAADGSETSLNAVHRLELASARYQALAPMPVAVDDTVSLVYQQRYVYLVSGWHDSGNVNLVQVYDVVEDRWFQATPYPGEAVFGHAGGISDRRLLVCDGVAIRFDGDGKRRFEASAACFTGRIDSTDPARIDWRPVASHPGLPRYRMAAAGTRERAQVLFVGGSENPYNYDGIGYDGAASNPSATVLVYDFDSGGWRSPGRLPVATMDHRGLLQTAAGWVLVGGMRAGQQVSSEVLRFRLPPGEEDVGGT